MHGIFGISYDCLVMLYSDVKLLLHVKHCTTLYMEEKEMSENLACINSTSELIIALQL